MTDWWVLIRAKPVSVYQSLRSVDQIDIWFTNWSTHFKAIYRYVVIIKLHIFKVYKNIIRTCINIVWTLDTLLAIVARSQCTAKEFDCYVTKKRFGAWDWFRSSFESAPCRVTEVSRLKISVLPQSIFVFIFTDCDLLKIITCHCEMFWEIHL